MRNCHNSVARIVLVLLLCVSFVSPGFAAFTLDPTFDVDGKQTLAFPDSSTSYSSSGHRIFIQPSGRIVAVGSFTSRTADGAMPGIAIVGLTQSGGLDSTFTSVFDWQGNGFTSLSDAEMYPDGRVVWLRRFMNVVGSSTVHASRTGVNGGDDGFGSNVNIGTGLGNFGTDRGVQVGVRPDGKVLALIVLNGQFVLYRLKVDGTRDTTFGNNGSLTLPFNKFFTPSNSTLEMVVLPDGKVVLAGLVAPATGDNTTSEFFLARLTESGTWDKTFGRAGFVRVPFGAGLTGRIGRARLQADGRILLCGSVVDGDTDTWMMRFTQRGRPDNSFGNGGVSIVDIVPGGIDVANSMALSPDGKIRTAGFYGNPANFLVARFSSAGAFEESTTFPFTPGTPSSASDIALQPDGKIVVIGGTRNPDAMINGNVFAVARLIE